MSRVARIRERLAVTPQRYALIAAIALGALTVIVFTGAAVRVTGSGLGCPEWPKCETTSVVPTEVHAPVAIEFGNRLLTSVVTAASLAALLFAWTRKPFRRDLVVLAAILPVGVALQAVIGGISVLVDLDYWSVMLHFLVSAVLLIPAAMLVWKAREPRDVPRGPLAPDRAVARAVWWLAPLGLLTLFMGTAATAAGPHSGGEGTGDVVQRLELKGEETLDFVIHQHGLVATVLGLGVVGAWFLARRRGAGRELLDPLLLTGILIGSQGAIGGAQYAMELPDELVWLHVVVATLTWLSLVWAVLAAGRPRDVPSRPSPLAVPAPDAPPAERETTAAV
ncbi:heme A synthase [Conexibacter sp. SYSU D00693]|uniref:COX15/CtaA family protein n=1 Tax=Conexibacter sp. SYSU D00693 TaxID=2812560 RepID=UPI00196A34C0|nr:COX15/CtaA family protein [Conexibacter sp. SYSU D00693]